MRRALTTVTLTTALLTIIPAASAALALSPEQLVARDLGDFDASVQLPLVVAAGETAPLTTKFDHALEMAGARAPTDVLTAWGVPLGGSQSTVNVKEGNWAESSRRYSLTHGAWPMHPGDAVIVNPTSEFSTLTLGSAVSIFNGRRSVTLVGFALDPFAERDSALLTAPGTWKSLGSTLRVAYPNVTGSVTRFWKATDPIAKESVIDAWVSANPVSDTSDTTGIALSYTTRHGLLATSADPLLSRFPLALMVPLIALPLATALLIGVTLRRWLSRTGRTLWQVGVPTALVTRSGRHAAAWIAAIGLVTGAAAGTLVAGLVRPALDVVSTQPLSPWSVPWSALGLIATGLAAGLLSTLSTRRSRWRFISGRWLLQLGLAITVGVTVVALATGITAVSLSVATGSVILAVALCSPGLLRVGIRLPSGSSSVARLPRLLINADRTRAAVAISGLIVALALPISAITVVLTAEAAEQRASLDTLPAGYVLMQSLDDEGIPAAIRHRFEDYTGLRNPVPVVMTIDDERSPHFSGAIWEFGSVAAVEKWLRHTLPSDQVQTLRHGLLTTVDGAANTITLRQGKATVTLPAVGLPVEPEWPQNVGAVVLKGTVPASFPRAPATLIYPDVTTEQLALVRSAASTLGFSRDYVRYPHATDAVTFPTRYFVAIAAMGLAPVLIMGAWASAQARQSRPALAGLRALGLPRRTLASVIIRQAGLLVGLATFATVVSVFIVATAVSLGSDDHLVIVPWQGVVITGASALVSVAVATASGLHRLTSGERLSA